MLASLCLNTTAEEEITTSDNSFNCWQVPPYGKLRLLSIKIQTLLSPQTRKDICHHPGTHGLSPLHIIALLIFRVQRTLWIRRHYSLKGVPSATSSAKHYHECPDRLRLKEGTVLKRGIFKETSKWAGEGRQQERKAQEVLMRTSCWEASPTGWASTLMPTKPRTPDKDMSQPTLGSATRLHCFWSVSITEKINTGSFFSHKSWKK